MIMLAIIVTLMLVNKIQFGVVYELYLLHEFWLNSIPTFQMDINKTCYFALYQISLLVIEFFICNLILFNFFLTYMCSLFSHVSVFVFGH